MKPMDGAVFLPHVCADEKIPNPPQASLEMGTLSSLFFMYFFFYYFCLPSRL